MPALWLLMSIVMQQPVKHSCMAISESSMLDFSNSIDTKAHPLHIVHGVISLDVGGMERIVVDLTREGRKKDCRVTVICIEKRGVLAPVVESLGGTVISLDKPAGLQKRTVDHAEMLLRELSPDVVHTHQIGALWYLGKGAKKSDTAAIIHTEHIDNVGKSRGLWRKIKTRLLWNRAAKYCDRFCCVSEDIAKSAQRWGTVAKSKVRVVLNGIDVERYSGSVDGDAIRRQFGIRNDAIVVGTVGRLAEVKNQELLIRAASQLVATQPMLHLLVVGDGPERQNLTRLATDLGLSERVTFAGYQAAPERLLSAMDIFALTSRLEGLPLAMLEAWATGLPVVSSAVGGIPKVVQDGENGLLFPNGDLPQLVKHLGDLLGNQERRASLAKAGYQAVSSKYSLSRMAADYDTIYRELITS